MHLFTTAVALVLCLSSTALSKPLGPDLDLPICPGVLYGKVDPNILKSCEGFALQDAHILVAKCKNNWCKSVNNSFDLNTVLGNNNGKFQWGSSHYVLTAKNVQLETSETVLNLKADLKNLYRRHVPASVDLTARIKNVKGQLTFE
ncbi:CVNH domain-containing protein [Mortierella sp. GBAus27b]|nr:CVNH domain-containing protein [Mortierella sp. GBAus27b]